MLAQDNFWRKMRQQVNLLWLFRQYLSSNTYHLIEILSKIHFHTFFVNLISRIITDL